MNTPYVKQYNEEGEVINPINGKYVSQFPNRRARANKKQRFMNNSKSFPLIVFGKFKFKKVIQKEIDKQGKVKRIEHTIHF